jgi:hypothetical protein
LVVEACEEQPVIDPKESKESEAPENEVGQFSKHLENLDTRSFAPVLKKDQHPSPPITSGRKSSKKQREKEESNFQQGTHSIMGSSLFKGENKEACVWFLF